MHDLLTYNVYIFLDFYDKNSVTCTSEMFDPSRKKIERKIIVKAEQMPRDAKMTFSELSHPKD